MDYRPMVIQGALSVDSVQVQLQPMDAVMAATLAAGGHAVLRLYNAARSETVFATAANENFVTIVRGDSPYRWAPGDAAVVTSVSPNSLTKDEEDEILAKLIGAIVGDGSLSVSKSASAILFGLNETGVAPGSYGGMQVDRFGRITYVPVNWPQNALPVFNPGGFGSGGSSGSPGAAASVSYTPAPSADIATGNNVQVAVQQIEAAVQAILADEAMELQSVIAGTGITVSGALTDPTVSITPTGIAPGTYNGFTVSATGQISAYAPAATNDVVVAGAGAMTSTYNAGTRTYTITADNASITSAGVVTLTDPASITAGAVENPSSSVPTYQGVVNFFNAQNVQINRKPAFVTEPVPYSSTAIYDAATAKEVKASLLQARMFGTTGGTWNGSTLAAGRNVSNVTLVSTGVYRVTVTSALPSANYVVRVNSDAGVYYTITNGGSGTFNINFFRLNLGSGASDPIDPSSFIFVVENF